MEPNFVKIYTNNNTNLYGLTTTTSAFILELMQEMNCANRIILCKITKEDIANRLKVKIKTIDSNLQKLLKKNIIKRMGTNIFMMNPNLFATGTWSNTITLRKQYDTI